MLRLVGSLLLLFLLPSCSVGLVSKRDVLLCNLSPNKVSSVEKLAKKGFVEAKICAGKLFLRSGNYGKARFYLVEGYRKSRGKERGEAAYLIGVTFLKEGKLKEARAWFWKAIKSGYPNREFFKLTDYLSLKEIKELEELGKEEPILYLYLGDYLREGELFRGALFYYQIAIRYGIKEARVGSAICLFKLGNGDLARSIINSEYKRGNHEAARIMGELLSEEASKGGECLVLTEVDPEEFVRERVREMRRRAVLYREAADWFRRARDEERAKEAYSLYLAFSFRGKVDVPRGDFSEEELKELCREGKLWAEYLLAKRLKTPTAEAAVLLYRKVFQP